MLFLENCMNMFSGRHTLYQTLGGVDFPLSRPEIYSGYSRRLEDFECVEEVLSERARGRGQTNDLCDQWRMVLSED